MTLFIAHPLTLIAIPIIMGIWYIYARERVGTIHPNPLIQRYLRTPTSIWILYLIQTLLVTCLVSIIAGVSIVQTHMVESRVSQDIVIVFDISLSMLAEDISPNRITVAKGVVKNFVSSRRDDRIALIIFAGKPWVALPYSRDYSGISSIIWGLSPSLIRQDLPGLSGTNIGDALLLANMTSSGSRSPAKSIILLTDGRANTGIDPMISASESRAQWVQIYTVGIGSLSWAVLSYTDSYGVKQYFSDGSGRYLQSDLDEPMMRELAETTSGEYFRGEDRSGLERVFREIGSSMSHTTETRKISDRVDMTPVLILISLILLICERYTLRYAMRGYRLIL